MMITDAYKCLVHLKDFHARILREVNAGEFEWQWSMAADNSVKELREHLFKAKEKDNGTADTRVKKENREPSGILR